MVCCRVLPLFVRLDVKHLHKGTNLNIRIVVSKGMSSLFLSNKETILKLNTNWVVSWLNFGFFCTVVFSAILFLLTFFLFFVILINFVIVLFVLSVIIFLFSVFSFNNSLVSGRCHPDWFFLDFLHTNKLFGFWMLLTLTLSKPWNTIDWEFTTNFVPANKCLFLISHVKGSEHSIH